VNFEKLATDDATGNVTQGCLSVTISS